MTDPPFELELFPLRTVLFPQGLLALRVFEARYLDLVADCLRGRRPFGVVCLREGGEVRHTGGPVLLEPVGTLAHIELADSEQAGILELRCRGGRRFRISGPHERDSGLWVAQAKLLDDPPAAPPTTALQPAVEALQNAIAELAAQGERRCLEPLRFDDAGWVADRWAELLPLSLAARQKLLELDAPLARLRMVDDFLRRERVID